MSSYRVLFKRVISADGRAIAEAHSEVFAIDNSESSVVQSVTVHGSSSGISSSASSRSSSHASAQADE